MSKQTGTKTKDRKIVMLLAFALAAPTIFAQVRARHDFSGKWQMNIASSEDVMKKVDALRGSASSGKRGYGNRTADARDREREGTRRRIEALIEASETLNISQSGNEVTVTEGDLRERKLYTDGRAYQREDRRGNPVTIKAQWRGERLVVTTKLADGGSFSETYELASGGRQLFVTVKSEDQRLRRALVIRRVYDAMSNM